MHFNRFDICTAFYMFAMLYHGGQNSKEYRIFGRLQKINFKVVFTRTSPSDMNDNTKEIYKNLLERNGYKVDECDMEDTTAYEHG